MKIITGKVISTKMKNTATVSVDSVFMHKLYGKRFKRSKKYHVHDVFGSNVGDVVSFVASKPYSRIKKWKIVKVGSVGPKVPKKSADTKELESPIKKSVKKTKK